MATSDGQASAAVDESDTAAIQMGDQRVKFINKRYKKVQANMYDSLCDIKLQVGSASFRAHKAVLADASMYFEAMFGHNMKEKEQTVIELHDLSPKGFTEMMEYFYHGYVMVDKNNIADILEAARFFHIEWLINICCTYLINNLSLEDYESVLFLADKYYLGDLKKEIFEHISLKFHVLSKNPTFMMVSFEILHGLLLEDYYIEATESYIFHTLLRWFYFKKDEREKYRVDLLNLIKFPLLMPEDLENVPEEILDLPEIRPLIEQAQEYHANPSARCVLASDKSEPRGAKEALVLIEAINDAQTFLYKIPGIPGFLRDEIDTSFMDSVIEFASVAVLGNYLFVAGGYDRRTWCSSPASYQYDPKTRQWFQLCSMLRPRVSFPLCASDTGVYAVAGVEHIVEAGMDKENIHTTVEVYDPHTNAWEFLPELLHGRFSCAAAVLKQNLYISGGISSDPEDNVPVNYFHVYFVAEKIWVTLAPMLTARQSHAMATVNNKLYVLGGYMEGQDTMSFDNCFQNEVYDIELDQWSKIKEIPLDMGHWFGSATAVDDKIYVLGGISSQPERTLYSYDCKEDEIGDGEFCGPCVQKIVLMKVPVPSYLLSEPENL